MHHKTVGKAECRKVVNGHPRMQTAPRATKHMQHSASRFNLQHTHGNRTVQRFLDHARPSAPIEDFGKQIGEASACGSHLDASTRLRLEISLGTDLSQVRIHTGHKADQLCQTVAARAFTTGQDIFFRGGMYQPGTPEGLHLLAHEVAHTIQQANGPVEGKAIGGVRISEPNDRFERAAEIMADRVTDGTQAISCQRVEPQNAPLKKSPGSRQTLPGSKTGRISPVIPIQRAELPWYSHLGPLYHGANSLFHTGKAFGDILFDNGPAVARDDATTAGMEAVKAIPFLGTGFSAFEYLHDNTGPTVLEPEPGESFGRKAPTLEEKLEDWLFGPE